MWQSLNVNHVAAQETFSLDSAQVFLQNIFLIPDVCTFLFPLDRGIGPDHLHNQVDCDISLGYNFLIVGATGRSPSSALINKSLICPQLRCWSTWNSLLIYGRTDQS